jgi:hypothetical protein
MSYVSDDRNYTANPAQSGMNPPSSSSSSTTPRRAGDATGQPPTNEPVDRDRASKLANLLEDMKFPATKEEIKDHLNRKSPAAGNMTNDVMESILNNLQEGVRYENVYQVEKAAGLVKEVD